jgi:4'-phosphopantetheinyl transferase
MSMPDAVRVWLIRTDLPEPARGALSPVLDEPERQRADALLHDRDRGRFIVAHAASRLILAGELGVPAEQVCFRHGPHGKPELAEPWAGVHVNLSHSGDLALLAVTGHGPVGVDVQQLPPGLDATGMATRFFPAPEAQFVAAGTGPDGAAGRFARLWARKEACVKASGGRLMQGMPLPVRGRGRIVVAHPGGRLPGPYLVTDVPVPPRFRAAVALLGTRPYRLVRQWWQFSPL